MNKKEVLQKIDLGNSIAEYDENISQYYITTQSTLDLINDRYDIIKGVKGSGKTAMLIAICDNQSLYPQLENKLLIKAIQLKGDPDFKRAFSTVSIKTSDIQKLIDAWKIYLINVIWKECKELFELAKKQKCVLMEGIKTAYSTAYSRLLLLAKSGEIGKIVSVDATCTSMRDDLDSLENKWNSISAWGPTALLPIFQLLGINYTDKKIISHYIDDDKMFDGFTKIDFIYPDSVASIKVAKTAKSEGELIITGTKGYIYVPAPWWKTDYFEIRYEDPTENKRYFYKLDGEGIRYEIVAFNRSIESGKNYSYIDSKISIAISEIIEACKSNNVIEI